MFELFFENDLNHILRIIDNGNFIKSVFFIDSKIQFLSFVSNVSWSILEILAFFNQKCLFLYDTMLKTVFICKKAIYLLQQASI